MKIGDLRSAGKVTATLTKRFSTLQVRGILSSDKKKNLKGKTFPNPNYSSLGGERVFEARRVEPRIRQREKRRRARIIREGKKCCGRGGILSGQRKRREGSPDRGGKETPGGRRSYSDTSRQGAARGLDIKIRFIKKRSCWKERLNCSSHSKKTLLQPRGASVATGKQKKKKR